MRLLNLSGVTLTLVFLLTPRSVLNAAHSSPSDVIGCTDLITDRSDESMLKRYTAYNLWANQQLADWLRTAPNEALNLNIQSSFSTLQETVFHIWNAEHLWLAHVKNEPVEASPSDVFEGTKDEMLDAWLATAESFRDHVAAMTIDAPETSQAVVEGQGFTVVDMIHHCMNHSTYHRGQLITMGRQAGLADPPRTDFIYYVRAVEE
jgi:uncharacterized damage-inducible protein DinB